MNSEEINLPHVMAFYRYGQALVSNNIDTLDALFWHDERTVHLGAGENLYSIEQIRAFRRCRAGTHAAQ